MFVAQAHSFSQQARLAITLSWVAGYTNTLTILTCDAVTSHVSGTTSSFGRAVAEGSWGVAGFLLFLLTSFLFGAVISGYTTELGHRRAWASIYVLPMSIEAVLLAVFALSVELHGHRQLEQGAALLWMTGVASAAMGLQNATITRISNSVVRTTHVTGVLTDLGLEAVQFLWWLRDRRCNAPQGLIRAIVRSVQTHPTAGRLVMLASIVGSFALGAGLGTFAFDHLAHWSMCPPVAFLVWIIYQDRRHPIAEIEPFTLESVTRQARDGLAVFHLRNGASGDKKSHHMPNLQLWSERLAPTIRVVILDIGDMLQLDANAALELRALLAHFDARRRRLIIAGVSEKQMAQFRRAGVKELLDPQNICPDLDIAIARGLVLLDDMQG